MTYNYIKVTHSILISIFQKVSWIFYG